MRILKVLGIPILIAAVALVYWLVSHEVAGAVMLAIFAVAMALFSWVLVPTFDDVGPTAPVDPDWHQREA